MTEVSGRGKPVRLLFLTIELSILWQRGFEVEYSHSNALSSQFHHTGAITNSSFPSKSHHDLFLLFLNMEIFQLDRYIFKRIFN